MQFFFRNQSKITRLLFIFLLCLFPFLFAFGPAFQHFAWLAFVLIPVWVTFLWIGPHVGAVVFILATGFIVFLGLLQTEGALTATVHFHLGVLLAGSLPVFLIRQRAREEERLQRAQLSQLKESITLLEEEYKAALVVNISDQKKIQKYSLLNRVSRVFGSKLELAMLADVVVHEMREIIGPERGAYSLALNLAELLEPLVRVWPDGPAPEGLMDDAYAEWVTTHRTSLLVADTARDFRFQSLAPDAPLRSVMVVPLLSDGRVIGLLRAESSWPGMFTADDLRLLTIVGDLTSISAENARLYQRAQELAITDGLTGLYLRRFYNQRFEEEINRYYEHGTPFSLLMLDLDHFKRVNDRWGHLAGDQILVQLANILRSEARLPDILCRYGGEEFSLLLPNTRQDGALVMAERIRRKVSDQPFHAGNEELQLTVSIGIAECPLHGDNITDLIRVTDTALYQAKRNGRNQVTLAVREA